MSLELVQSQGPQPTMMSWQIKMDLTDKHEEDPEARYTVESLTLEINNFVQEVLCMTIAEIRIQPVPIYRD